MSPLCERREDGTVVSRCCARIGLLGNPSDGYGGAVIGCSLANFAAEVLQILLPPRCRARRPALSTSCRLLCPDCVAGTFSLLTM